MKNISIKLFGAAALLTATFTASAQNVDMRKVSSFHGIGAAGAFNIHVKVDGKEDLRITGPSDILKEIETPVEDGILQIRFRKDFHHEDSNEKIDVYVSAKTLSSLSSAGAVKIEVEEGALTGETVKVSTAGAGKITAEVKASSLDASTAGSANLTLKGSAASAKYSLNGAGKLNAHDLKSEDVKINIAGAGDAQLYADKTISASIAGSGKIQYRGNATIEHYTSAGSGRVTKEKGE